MSLKEVISPILQKFCNSSNKQKESTKSSSEEDDITKDTTENQDAKIQPEDVPKKSFKKAYSVETSGSGTTLTIF